MTKLPFRWHTAAAIAVTCFMGGVAVSIGAHGHRVDVAVEQAREQARVLTERRDALQVSLSRATEVTLAATELDHGAPVVEAAHAVTRATATAVHTASENRVEIASAEAVAPTWANAPHSGVAPAPAAVAVSPSVAPTPLATAADAALEDVVDDHEVAAVLRGDADSVAEVEEVTAALEEAAAELDAVQRHVDGTTDALEERTAVASLAESATALAAEMATAGDTAAEATRMLEATRGKVVDPAARLAVLQARDELLNVPPAGFDSEAAVATRAAEYAAAAQNLADAEARLATSHAAWVSAENDRRDQVNVKREKRHAKAVDAARAGLTADYLAAVAAHLNGWSGQPTGVAYANGYLPSSALCTPSFAPGALLHCDAVAALELADADYHAQTGAHLALSSSYRSYSAQISTRATRGYLAATPGSSNHGWGVAADFEPASAAWMRAHGERYGWVHPLWARYGGVKPESWHLEFVATGVSPSVADEPELLQPVSNVLER